MSSVLVSPEWPGIWFMSRGKAVMRSGCTRDESEVWVEELDACEAHEIDVAPRGRDVQRDDRALDIL